MSAAATSLAWGLFAGVVLFGTWAAVYTGVLAYRRVVQRRPDGIAVLAAMAVGWAGLCGLWLAYAPYLFIRWRRIRATANALA